MGYPAGEEDEVEESVTHPKSEENGRENEPESKYLTLNSTNTGNERNPSGSVSVENGQSAMSTQERRSSLPPGVLENGHITSICGQILRYIGDEQCSMACGRHLRCLGDQLSYRYFVQNMVRRSGEFHSHGESQLTASHSSPNLSQQDDHSDKNV